MVKNMGYQYLKSIYRGRKGVFFDPTKFCDQWSNLNSIHAIISCSLYIFYPIFHCRLFSTAVSITDNLYTKQGNSSSFGRKIRGL